MPESQQCLSREDVISRLLRSYQTYYNIHRFDGGESLVREGAEAAKGSKDEEVSQSLAEKKLSLIARCDYFEHAEKFVISRKAELWSSDSEEFLYFFSVSELTLKQFQQYRDYVLEDGFDRMNIGPGHMYSYLTVIIVCDFITDEAKQALKKCRKYKSFHFSLHGWMDYRNAAVVTSDNSIIHNFAGHATAKMLNQILFKKRRVRR